ncbi:PstS family phosphate ABC transporter substrate-binding protein [Geobacter grbiciae]|uniref:PstS family phosphate ABC transporter substrate-binding protein n=1 Tax=Geobacter grbiciae TaxID=155042 RepID=UPI001C01120E|nr:substrate-binding domain-containing protein [Geobacter grbiciae]MBT1077047.1 substrate-binding domain-containing protein [Geobacter grbiciae]
MERMERMVLTFFVAVMMSAVTSSWAQDPPIVVAGSGTCIPIVRILAEEFQRFHPGMEVRVPPSVGSAGGVTAVADGAVEIGMVSRPLLTDEAEKGLVFKPFARTAIVFAVSPSVPDRDLSSADIVAIYRGQKNRWKNGRTIVVLTREPRDSGIAVLRGKIPGFGEAYDASRDKKFWATFYTDQEMNQALARSRDVLGITDRGAVVAEKLPVKMLSLNGVEPHDNNVRSGRYPLSKTLAFVHRPGTLSRTGTSFLRFVFSGRGRKILKMHGYLPE